VVHRYVLVIISFSNFSECYYSKRCAQ